MRRYVGRLWVLAAVAVAAAACGGSDPAAGGPELAPRGETMTTAKPTRQNLANRVSLAGKVTMNPVFGLVSPVGGQVRYVDVTPPRRTPTKPTRVATVWAGERAHRVTVPAGATFAGRLVDDRSTVTAGMPIVSAKLAGYGIVAEIDGAQAYRIADSLASVRAQIKNGPGPFACTVLGTIAALPAGTIPDPPAQEPSQQPGGQQPGQLARQLPGQQPGQLGTETAPPAAPEQQPQNPEGDGGTEGSEPSGLRLVCTPPAGVKLINGASATLEVVTEQATNVLVVPVEAVAGTQGKGKVDIVRPDRTRETRDVVLGLSDGKVVQIKSGLTGNETLAVPGPNLPPAMPADGQQGEPR